MATATQLIRRNKQRPIRRAYIDRRLFSDGSYEGTFTRLDNYRSKDRVLNWGSASYQINNTPGKISSFEVSSYQITFRNEDGLFNRESDSNSYWNDAETYIRQFSKIKIEAGYIDEDGAEVGVTNVFEGVIDKIIISEDHKARISVLSYQTILQRFNVEDLSFAGTGTVNSIVDAIMNQSKITQYIPHVAAAADQNITIDKTKLSGTYWDVIKNLASFSNSIPFLVGTTWAFKPRTIGVSSVYDFKGTGTTGPDDIFKIMKYDDEGADRVRTNFVDSFSGLTSATSDTALLKRYLSEPETVDFEAINTNGDRQTVLDAVLGEWENPKPTVEFSTRFLLSEVEPLDKITIEILGRLTQQSNGFRWGQWTWGDGSVWGGLVGSINILSGSEWMVTRIKKDFNTWQCIIKAEKVS